MDSLACQVLSACRKRGWTCATAESCTGGMVAAALTGIAGSSDVVDRGFITYSNAAKNEMLGVLPATLKTHGAVSEQVAVEMASGALSASGVSLTVSITGIAGPGPSAHKPEGRVCFAVAQKDRPTYSVTIEFGPIGRKNVREKATRFALELLLKAAS